MKNKKGFTLTELLIAVVILGLLLLPIPLWTGRNLDFWISHYKGHAVHVPFLLDVLLSVFSGGMIIFLNILAEIARYFI